jgi:hypothetical protein
MAPNGQHQSRPGAGSTRAGARADRSARFLARVDDHLPRLADDAARRAFIAAQIEGWEHRYARFVASEGGSEVADPGDPPTAADFLLTITGLASRGVALRRRRSAERRDPLPFPPPLAGEG